jgi:hypothetical protein
VSGAVFQLPGSGAAMSVCISGLTVPGTGSVRAGILRGSGAVGVCDVVRGTERRIIAAAANANLEALMVRCKWS